MICRLLAVAIHHNGDARVPGVWIALGVEMGYAHIWHASTGSLITHQILCVRISRRFFNNSDLKVH